RQRHVRADRPRVAADGAGVVLHDRARFPAARRPQRAGAAGDARLGVDRGGRLERDTPPLSRAFQSYGAAPARAAAAAELGVPAADGAALMWLTATRERAPMALFGPVLFYDLVRTARRPRYFLLRTLYATGLLLLLCWVYTVWSAESVRFGHVPSAR